MSERRFLRIVADVAHEIGGRASAYLAAENSGPTKQRIRAMWLHLIPTHRQDRMRAGQQRRKTCERKMRYADAYIALRTSAWLSNQYAATIRPYPCTGCWGWHVTSWPQSYEVAS